MKTIIFATMLMMSLMISFAQKPNLDKLPEKERNEYLLKTAYETVMKHAPEWYSDFKEPVIVSYMSGPIDKPNKLVFAVRYLPDPEKMNINMVGDEFAVAVAFNAETGEVDGLGFGDGLGFSLKTPPTTRSGEQAKPRYFPNPYLKK